ncbi:MAG: hypothetical protein RIB67_04785 [Miltoncostaeaceae bacterium]
MTQAIETTQTTLPSGAEMRTHGPGGARPVVCVNGGQGGDVPGDWSPSFRWLIAQIAPERPDLTFHLVRYRLKSWNRLQMCIDDALDAIEAVAHAGPVTLLGFSMGGAVSVAASAHPAVERVIGLAPWLPAELDPSGLRGKGLTIVHGSLDAYLPGIPGVAAVESKRAASRLRAMGIAVDRTVIHGAVHPVAIGTPWGGVIPAPRAGTWRRLTEEALDASRVPAAEAA